MSSFSVISLNIGFRQIAKQSVGGGRVGRSLNFQARVRTGSDGIGAALVNISGKYLDSEYAAWEHAPVTSNLDHTGSEIHTG